MVLSSLGISILLNPQPDKFSFVTDLRPCEASKSEETYTERPSKPM